MDVSELVIQIQQGKTELMETLWLEVKGLIAWYANLYYSVVDKSGRPLGGTTVSDLIQCGYFALVGAVEHYDPEKSKFTSFLLYYARREFQIAMGRRTSRTRNDPLNKSFTSLDAPIDEDGEQTLLDLYATSKLDDHDDYSALENRLYNEQLRVVLEEVLNQIPEKEASAIRLEFFEKKKLKEIGSELGCSHQYARRLRQQGLHHLRTGSARAKLERFVDENTPFYKGVSAQRFNETQTSQVERLVIRREGLRQRYGRMFNDNSEQENTGTDN